MRKYLFFNATTKAYIPSEIVDKDEAYRMWRHLIVLFPHKDWDYSNAEWTLSYFPGN